MKEEEEEGSLLRAGEGEVRREIKGHGGSRLIGMHC
jgi:hypothetical protein